MTQEKTVIGRLSKRRSVGLLSITIFVIAGACKHSHSSGPAGATAESDEVSQILIGKQITIRGKFSMNGVVGPYILLGNQQIVYVVPKSSFTWGKPYSEMEGKFVVATGTLGFFHSLDVPPVNQARARPPDYFYLEAETTQVRLVSQ